MARPQEVRRFPSVSGATASRQGFRVEFKASSRRNPLDSCARSGILGVGISSIEGAIGCDISMWEAGAERKDSCLTPLGKAGIHQRRRRPCAAFSSAVLLGGREASKGATGAPARRGSPVVQTGSVPVPFRDVSLTDAKVLLFGWALYF